MTSLSRRDFFKLSGAALAASAFGGLPPEDEPRNQIGLGRVMHWGTAIRSAPNREAPVIYQKSTEDILPVYGTALDPDESNYNRIWYIVPGGYVYSGVVQPVAYHINPLPNPDSLTEFPCLAEVTVPLTYARWGLEDRGNWAHKLYYQTTYWVHEYTQGRDGLMYYKILDDEEPYNYYSVRAAHMRLVSPIEVSPLSPGVRDKRVEVDLKQQQVTCFEGDTAVMTTRVATGRGGFATPKGEWRVRRKRPSRHMSSEGGDGAAAGPDYDLIGVPWVCYFLSGFSFHGTYWHNDYGDEASHGCVNMTPDAARWLYRWVEPVLPFGEIQSPKPEDGTPVIVF
jgi:hypothetical protein